MSAVIFATGKPHQEAAAIWARKRLADADGRRFSSPDDQDGVLFADGVGLGKTWEALSAAALILYKQKPKAGRRHVLIVCPANLVTKWEDELAGGSDFRKRLEKWQHKFQSAVAKTIAKRVVETLTHVLPIRSAKHVQTRRKHGKFHPPGGTYIVSQSLIAGRGRGLSALCREEWDVIIVDEAHNAAARKALEKLQSRRRAHTKLLLTATPFQLEPREWNRLATHLLKRSHKVLNQTDVASYIDHLADVFENPENQGPKPKVVAAASQILKRLAARTVPRASRRAYQILMMDGSAIDLPARLDELDDAAVRRLLEQHRRGNEDERDNGFEIAYFEKRLRLATNSRPTYVATSLRRVLAAGVGSAESPRRRALERWATHSLEDDIQRAIDTGQPRKMIVFTAWVGDATSGEAAALKKLLEAAYAAALGPATRRYGSKWDRWRTAGRHRLERKSEGTDDTAIGAALRALAGDELTSVLAGKHQRFASRLAGALGERARAIAEAKNELTDLQDRRSFEARSIRRRIRDMRAALSPWTTGRALGAVERYTGSEMRSVRDRVATAFREVGPPWVLVASNVGSEGIDLQTYTARIVHYDLEWNPAKMEQREGRGDRVGRRLTDKLAILYCLVPRTYDERMFHQLVARDRWHGVLLGRPASKLESSDVDAPLVDRKRMEKMRLDLAPPRNR